MKKIEITLCLLLFASVIWGQCPTDQICEDYTIEINLDDVPSCLLGEVFQTEGDIDNNSDCGDVNGDNCFKWILYRSSGSDIISVTADLGQGNGCNGEVDNIYLYSDNCIEYGSSGSQNDFTFEFGESDTLTIWMCDGSSGQVSMCNLCVNYNTLPIDLEYFRARNKIDDRISIEWKTSQEINNDFFTIEHSDNLVDWTQIAKINGTNSQSGGSKYSIIHRQTNGGDMYYRLTQTDTDGTRTIFDSNIVVAKVDTKEDVRDAMLYGEWFDMVGRLTDRNQRGLFMVRYKQKTYKIYR